MKKQLFKLVVSIVMVFGTLIIFSQNQQIQRIDQKFFIENKGQWPKEVAFLCRNGGVNLWITKSGAVYDFYRFKELEDNETCIRRLPEYQKTNIFEKYGQVIRLVHLQSNKNTCGEGIGKQLAYYNYFIGKDPSKWASFVGLYKEAWLKNVYKGIDQRWYFDKGYLRYDYVIHPYADYRQIQLKIEGTDKITIKNNQLVMDTRFGEVVMAELEVYQQIGDKQVKVPARWKQKEQCVYFELGEYNASYPLIIDPLVYSTFLGGSGSSDEGKSITTDANGNTYVTGYTLSSDFPTTPGCYDSFYNGGNDVFVSKLNNAFSALIYSTYIGGIGNDVANSLVLDANMNVYITGTTMSSDFPTTFNCYDNSYNGFNDIFITRLNTSGSALIYSTYVGGLYDDRGMAIVVDANGKAYITGYSFSSDFPTTPGCYDNTFNSSSMSEADVVVLKINNNGDSLLASTFVGGIGHEIGKSIAIDQGNNVYVSGFQLFSFGNSDAFVVKLNSNLNTLSYSILIGGNGDDCGNSLTVDLGGNVYLTGYTNSLNFPFTPNCFDSTYNGGSYDAFVCKINSNGSALIFSTYLGGSNSDVGNGIVIDSYGNSFLTGFTGSFDFPATIGSYHGTSSGADVFTACLHSNGNFLSFSTFIGGGGDEVGNSIAIDANGDVYITGYTDTLDFPTTPGSYDNTFNGGAGYYDAFACKFNIILTGQKELFPLKSWIIYPNPNAGEFYIRTIVPCQLEVLDITGRKIKEYDLKERGEYAVKENDFCTGVYFFREKKSTYVEKIIIE